MKMKTITLPGNVPLEMIWCPRGKFLMGSPKDEAGRWPDEAQHEVRLTRGFFIGKYPVTQTQWTAVMGNNPSFFNGPARPVEYVSWHDCQAFCTRLNDQLPGHKFDLPTEAQWEYACRAGTKGPYAGELDYMAWYDGEGTHPVGEKRPNAWGLYDMHGNVWEWCRDWYQEDLGTSAVTDPAGPDSGSSRVLRGACWYTPARGCRSAFRYYRDPSWRSSYVGFRLVMTLL